MMENEVSIDFSLGNIWKTWFSFRRGKKSSRELDDFQYHLENNLRQLFAELNDGTYHHGPYRKFIVCDNKKREIAVASVRDRLIHHILYDYLLPIYDKTFISDVWSCRKGKGLIGAINRAQDFLRKNPHGYVWKVDIRKFFDTVDHDTLLRIISRKINDPKALWLIKEIISSFRSERERESIAMPIGNLTSQIFANIYLDQLDHFIKRRLRLRYYLRYGDDFIIVQKRKEDLLSLKEKITFFLKEELQLDVHGKNLILRARHGLKFLGVIIYPTGKKLSARNMEKIQNRMNYWNSASYYGLAIQHMNQKFMNEFIWRTNDILEFF